MAVLVEPNKIVQIRPAQRLFVEAPVGEQIDEKLRGDVQFILRQLKVVIFSLSNVSYTIVRMKINHGLNTNADRLIQQEEQVDA